MRISINMMICRIFIFWTLVIHFFNNEKYPSVYAQSLVATYIGTNKMDRAGYYLSPVGDVNADGYDDFIIGGSHVNTYDGAAWLILGRTDGFLFNTSLNDVDACFRGKNEGDEVGISIGSRGDINGDGFDDILIGAAQSGSELPGHAYIIFGKASVDWGTEFILEDHADASFIGEHNLSFAGLSVDIIGDLNGDGYDEFLIGAPDELGISGGKAYLFKGKSSGWQRNIPVTDADASFHGEGQKDRAGYMVKGVGDVNGDGIPDFAIGAFGIGRVYLFFGRSSINWGKDFALGNADVIFTEENSNLYGVGFRIASAGDVDGDGFDDLLISDYSYDDIRGKVYLIFGKSTGSWSKNINLSQSDVSYIGEADGDQAGYFVNGDFDCNEDGLSDFLIGAMYNDQIYNGAGKAYLIKGKRSGWQSTVQLNTIAGTFYGDEEMGNFGFAVSGAGDVNDDGTDDFIISAAWWGDPYGGYGEGKIYLYLGVSIKRRLEGYVYYYTNVPVADVTVSVNGNPVTQTGVLAYYSLIVFAGEDVKVMPSKPSGEDIGETTITSYDAAITARSVVKLESLDADQIRVADVDESGSVTMYDAVQIARYAVGVGGGVHVGDWIFKPDSLVYADIQYNYEGQNFEAMVMGDVDGSWSPGLPKIGEFFMDTSVWDKSFSIEQDTLTLIFSVKEPIPLLSFDMALEYDERALDFLAIKKGTIGEPFQIFSSLDGKGLRAGGFCTEPVEEPGQLILIQFRMTKPVQDIGPVTLRRLQFNRDIIGGTMVLWDGEESISSRIPFFVYRNYPNPFNSSTTLQFEVPYQGQVRIVVFNQKGSVVCHLLDEQLTAGRHTVMWNGIDDQGTSVASGLYLIKILHGNLSETLKVLLLK